MAEDGMDVGGGGIYVEIGATLIKLQEDLKVAKGMVEKFAADVSTDVVTIRTNPAMLEQLEAKIAALEAQVKTLSAQVVTPQVNMAELTALRAEFTALQAQMAALSAKPVVIDVVTKTTSVGAGAAVVSGKPMPQPSAKLRELNEWNSRAIANGGEAIYTKDNSAVYAKEQAKYEAALAKRAAADERAAAKIVAAQAKADAALDSQYAKWTAKQEKWVAQKEAGEQKVAIASQTAREEEAAGLAKVEQMNAQLEASDTARMEKSVANVRKLEAVQADALAKQLAAQAKLDAATVVANAKLAARVEAFNIQKVGVNGAPIFSAADAPALNAEMANLKEQQALLSAQRGELVAQSAAWKEIDAEVMAVGERIKALSPAQAFVNGLVKEQLALEKAVATAATAKTKEGTALAAQNIRNEAQTYAQNITGLQGVTPGGVFANTFTIQKSMVLMSAELQKLTIDLNNMGPSNAAYEMTKAKIDAIAGRLRALRQAAGEMKAAMQQLGSTLQGIGMGLVMAGAVGAATIFGIGKIQSHIDQTRISLASLFGSMDAGLAFMKKLRDFSENTPFKFDILLNGAKELKAFGYSAEELIPTMQIIADKVAQIGADPEMMQRVITIFGKIRNEGKIMGRELLQLEKANIPVIKYLTEYTGESWESLSKRMRNPDMTISADVALPAFTQGMKKDSSGVAKAQEMESLSGKLSNAATNFQMAITKLGDAMKGNLMKIIDWGVSVLHAIENLSPATQKAIGDFLLFGSAGAVVTGVLALLASGIISIDAKWGQFAGVLAKIPNIAVVGPIVALIAAFVGLSLATEDGRKNLQAIGANLMAVGKNFMDFAKQVWSAVAGAGGILQPVIQMIGGFLKSITGLLAANGIGATILAFALSFKALSAVLPVVVTGVATLSRSLSALGFGFALIKAEAVAAAAGATGFAAATNIASVSVAGLSTAIKAAFATNPLGWIILGLSAVVAGTMAWNNANEYAANAGVRKATEAVQSQEAALVALKGKQADEVTQITKNIDTYEKLKKAQVGTGTVSGELKTVQDALAASFKYMAEQVGDSSTTWDENVDSVKKMTTQYLEMNKAIEESNIKILEQKAAVAEASLDKTLNAYLKPGEIAGARKTLDSGGTIQPTSSDQAWRVRLYNSGRGRWDKTNQTSPDMTEEMNAASVARNQAQLDLTKAKNTSALKETTPDKVGFGDVKKADADAKALEKINDEYARSVADTAQTVSQLQYEASKETDDIKRAELQMKVSENQFEATLNEKYVTEQRSQYATLLSMKEEDRDAQRDIMDKVLGDLNSNNKRKLDAQKWADAQAIKAMENYRKAQAEDAALADTRAANARNKANADSDRILAQKKQAAKIQSETNGTSSGMVQAVIGSAEQDALEAIKKREDEEVLAAFRIAAKQLDIDKASQAVKDKLFWEADAKLQGNADRKNAGIQQIHFAIDDATRADATLRRLAEIAYGYTKADRAAAAYNRSVSDMGEIQSKASSVIADAIGGIYAAQMAMQDKLAANGIAKAQEIEAIRVKTERDIAALGVGPDVLINTNKLNEEANAAYDEIQARFSKEAILVKLDFQKSAIEDAKKALLDSVSGLDFKDARWQKGFKAGLDAGMIKAFGLMGGDPKLVAEGSKNGDWGALIKGFTGAQNMAGMINGTGAKGGATAFAGANTTALGANTTALNHVATALGYLFTTQNMIIKGERHIQGPDDVWKVTPLPPQQIGIKPYTSHRGIPEAEIPAKPASGIASMAEWFLKKIADSNAEQALAKRLRNPIPPAFMGLPNLSPPRSLLSQLMPSLNGGFNGPQLAMAGAGVGGGQTVIVINDSTLADVRIRGQAIKVLQEDRRAAASGFIGPSNNDGRRIGGAK